MMTTAMTDTEGAVALPFPCARTTPARTPGGARVLGTGAMALQLGAHANRLSGHWCSRCQGIWFGLLLEAQCPACGNRRG